MRSYSKAVLVLLSSIIIAACSGPISLHKTSIEIFDPVNKRYYVVNEVPEGKIAKLNASFVWNYEGKAGRHNLKWDIYQNKKLLRKGNNITYLFKTSPTIAYINLDTSALGVGEYNYVLFVDNVKTATITIKIIPVQVDINKNIIY